ncbi:MAG: MerR family transcriptional regulator [Clostridia bacterium]|nr:MerR family transcriptional regulator [Clostridia bacterium]
MYSMKQACKETGLSYETLKFYCNQGLVPNVKRDENNYRIFDSRDIAWIKSLAHLKACGMSLQEMKTYLSLCMKGQDSIPERKVILARKRDDLLKTIEALNACIDYIDGKQQFYDDVLSGKVEYYSNLFPCKEK